MRAALEHWLESVGLGQYNELFVQHCIGLDILPDLTEQIIPRLDRAGAQAKRAVL